MAVLKVARLGHPVLRQVAEPVSPEAIRSPEIQRLIDDMLETMDDYDGAGLAAPQVHVSRRVVIYGVRGQSALPRRRGRAAHRAGEPAHHAGRRRSRRRTGRAASACPTCAAWCRAARRVRVEAYDRDGAPAALHRRRTSTPASCSTSAITSTATSTSIACARWRRSPSCRSSSATGSSLRVAARRRPMSSSSAAASSAAPWHASWRSGASRRAGGAGRAGRRGQHGGGRDGGAAGGDRGSRPAAPPRPRSPDGATRTGWRACRRRAASTWSIAPTASSTWPSTVPTSVGWRRVRAGSAASGSACWSSRARGAPLAGPGRAADAPPPRVPFPGRSPREQRAPRRRGGHRGSSRGRDRSWSTPRRSAIERAAGIGHRRTDGGRRRSHAGRRERRRGVGRRAAGCRRGHAAAGRPGARADARAARRRPVPCALPLYTAAPRTSSPRVDGRVLLGSTRERAGFDKRVTMGAAAALLAAGGRDGARPRGREPGRRIRRSAPGHTRRPSGPGRRPRSARPLLRHRPLPQRHPPGAAVAAERSPTWSSRARPRCRSRGLGPRRSAQLRGARPRRRRDSQLVRGGRPRSRAADRTPRSDVQRCALRPLRGSRRPRGARAARAASAAGSQRGLVLDAAQRLVGERLDRAHAAAAVAVRARAGQELAEALARALARHLDEAELGDAQDVGARLVARAAPPGARRTPACGSRPPPCR